MVTKKYFRHVAVLLTAAILFCIVSCSIVGPEQAPNSIATGSVAPRLIFFKATEIQAGGAHIYSDDTTFIDKIHITIIPSGGTNSICSTFAFSSHHAVLNNVPVGPATIKISSHTRTGDTLATGEGTLTVVAGQTDSPSVNVTNHVLAAKPVGIIDTQICDSKVNLSWKPTGYANGYVVKCELYKGGTWSEFHNDTISKYGDYIYNPLTDFYTWSDTSIPTRPDSIVRFYIKALDGYNTSPFSDFLQDTLVSKGACSGAGATGSVSLSFPGNVSIPSEDSVYISTIKITIIPNSGSAIQSSYAFSSHQAVLSNIPIGLATIKISAHTQTGDTLLKGEASFTVTANQSISPSVAVATQVLATKPVGLVATQICDGKVDLSWKPTGYAYGYGIKGEIRMGTWKEFLSDTILKYDYTYNRASDLYTCSDTGVPILTDSSVRFSIRALDYGYVKTSPFSDYAQITLVNKGSCSGVMTTGSVKIDFPGNAYLNSYDTMYISTIHITIIPNGGANSICSTLSFSSHHAVLNNVPSGPATIKISAHTQTGDTLLTGKDTFTVKAGQTVTPLVDVTDEVLATQPVGLVATQICDGKVDLTWRPTGYAPDGYEIKGERQVASTWVQFQSDTIEEDWDYLYNPMIDMYIYSDTNVPVLIGSNLRFSVRALDTWNDKASPFSAYAQITLVNKGACSGVVTNYYPYYGYVYGIVGQVGAYATRIKIYKADAGQPSFANLPADNPVWTWTYSDTIRPAVKFYLDSLKEGVYWVYAYNNLNGQDDWNKAYKRAIYTRTNTSAPTGSAVITMDFSKSLFLSGNNVSGSLNGSYNSKDYYAELYWYNEAKLQSYFLGFYYCGTGSTANMKLENVPSLSDMANYFQYTYNSSSDYYYLYVWNDMNSSETFNIGDLYYYDDYYSSWEYYIGDVTDAVTLGNIYLDSTYSGLAKKIAGKRVMPLR